METKMTNMPKLSNRAKKALEVLSNGGRFVKRLERNSYTGRDQFQTRLLATGAYSSVVRGVGMSAFDELDKLGMLVHANESTSVSTNYKLRTV
jgi:hypothetical protein